MSTAPLALAPALQPLHNGRAVPLDKVPQLRLGELQQAIVAAPSQGQRVASLFAYPTAPLTPGAAAELELVAVLAADGDGKLYVGRAPLDGERFPSLTPQCPEVHLFERELAEQWGLVPEGHPWLKPVRFVASNMVGRDAWQRPAGAPIVVGVTDFYRVEGAEVHEVAVGPVHAGVIEPGHFRFQCHGEQVFHLEISLGYQHRGVERALVGGPHKATIHQLETVAGDTTIGHATAYCQVVEGLAQCRVSARAQALRGIALELERLANHTGDLGALAGDVGYLPTASFCGRLRGDFLNMTALLCGSRFGHGLVRPGGVGFDVDAAQVDQLLERLDSAYRDVKGAADLLWQSSSVQARFEETGHVSADTARALGLVGPAARACGLRRDVRKTHPAGIFQFVHIPISTLQSGDVFARAFLRWLEIERSVQFVRTQLRELPKGELRGTLAALRPQHLCVTLVEGWRGEICHTAITDGQGRLAHYKLVDPSFHNWTGLAMALRDQAISDFPLCNKSFNLSYCGHDL